MIYPDPGHLKFKEHLAAVTALMRAAPKSSFPWMTSPGDKVRP